MNSTRRDGTAASSSKTPLTDGGGPRVELRKLSIINQLAMVGVDGMNDELAGVGENGSARLHLRQVDFFDVLERHAEVGDEKVVGIRARLKDVPGGHLLLLFEPGGAQYLAQLLIEDESRAEGNTADGGRISEREAQKFVGHIGDMMLGGFIGGWENALGREIGHESPKILYSSADDLVREAADAGDNLAALHFYTQLQFDTGGSERADVDTSIYAFPDNEVFAELLNALGK